MENVSLEQTDQVNGAVKPPDEDPLTEEARKLHLLFKNQGDKLSQAQKDFDLKVLKNYRKKIENQLVSNSTPDDLDLYALAVIAGGYTHSSIALEYVSYIDCHTGKWIYPTPHYFPHNEPCTNYSTVWVLTFDSQVGADVLRPYIMPGLSATAPGATLDLHSMGNNVWRVEFHATSSTHHIYTTSEVGGFVGLYVKENLQDVYLVPKQAVEHNTDDTDIVGTLSSNVSNVHVWRKQSVPTDYIFPVPEFPE